MMLPTLIIAWVNPAPTPRMTVGYESVPIVMPLAPCPNKWAVINNAIKAPAKIGGSAFPPAPLTINANSAPRYPMMANRRIPRRCVFRMFR